ncbi:FAD-dependent monooxygenase [Nocardia seriolae]|uniref:FAD-binding monooxygenase n=1 Tax=Nocardia seriolae TaxID=37332 RepID=A0A0B8N290_9NOCA|nr:FAD-dependent monooxygenase [Nocardia seriolae]MTJ61504.1 FAD-binding monooxygenase [Nocardia seriolae]MTJ71361.1 FAD-binding monooxygenase [Nocardia seriolae]MTJ86533.1 FAD-binding monooxygenase [Nocardia seriolae]MTK30528.1 FAD-binding monooxygenase [Nocardia seriolae]MTK39474.1 FAD-binding monooxygenase [Nocardia seriolae]
MPVTAEQTVDVLIVGGGPTGMAMALELRSRGVDFLIAESGDGSIGHPKVSGIGPRSMEFFRRWGIADRVRQAGWPGDHPLDCAWVTRIGGHELFRVHRHTMDTRPDYLHTPEPDAICPQHWLAPLLRAELARTSGGALRMRTLMADFDQDDECVRARLVDLESDRRWTVRARYLIACDGASSAIRRACGIAAPPLHATQTFRNILFRAPDLRARLGRRAAGFYYLMLSDALRFPVRALDGRELYRLTVGVHGDPEAEAEPDALVRNAIAFDTPVEVLSDNEWHLVHRVAERFRHERVFLVGDAAHTLSPSGGFGMNTGICGAADLGWKLSATLAGWAGAHLLDSYTVERRPVALEGIEEANRNLERAMRRRIPEGLDEDSPHGVRMRARLGEALAGGGVAREFDAPEIHLGFGYPDSPLVVPDPEHYPGDVADRRPNTRPGSRAPHAWLEPGRSTLDLFGSGFVLLCFTAADGVAAMATTFADKGIPFSSIVLDRPDIAEVYERRFVLVRPDGHVAWRGNELPADPESLADRVRGANLN